MSQHPNVITPNRLDPIPADWRTRGELNENE